MRSWFRIVLPPGWVVGSFVCLYLVGEGIYWLTLWLGRVQPDPEIMIVRDFVLIAAALSYAGFRVTGFHPLYQREYREWLERSPWTIAKPLPVGPIHLVIQDGVVLLILFLLAQHRPYFDPKYLPLFFLCGYLVQLAATFWPIGFGSFSYGLAFGLGLVVLFWTEWEVAVAAAAALYPFGFAGLSRSLASFPWDVPWYLEHRGTKMSWKEIMQQYAESQEEHLLGWPFGRLPPRPATLGISYRDGILLSLLAGWWVYVFAARMVEAGAPAHLVQMLMVASFGGLLFGGLYRLVIYCWAHRPPISFWGRVITLRWIIPSYDKVLFAPLAAVIVPIAVVVYLLQQQLLPIQYSCPIPVMLGLLILLTAGPTLQSWQLTGGHRVVPGITKTNFLPHLTKDFSDELIEL